MKIRLNTLQLFILVFTISIGASSCSIDQTEPESTSTTDFSSLNKQMFFDVKKLIGQSETSRGSLTEAQAQATLEGMLSGAIDFLYERNFTTEELILEFGNLNNPSILASASYLANLEYSISGEYVHYDWSLSTKAVPDGYDCLLRAVGIDAVVELVNGKVTKQLAKKAIRKIVSRTLGWVGVAIAIYEFGSCMEWY